MAITLSSKGEIVLPKDIIAHKNWMSGTHLEIEEKEDGVLIKEIKKKKSLTKIKGFLKGFNISGKDIKAMRREDELHDSNEFQ